MFRIAMASLAAVLTAGAATAQEKKADPIPPPRVVPMPMPMPMPPAGGAPGSQFALPTGPSPGTLWDPAKHDKYPVPGQIVVVPGNAYAYLPSRAVYGPSASPNDYPYGSFLPGHTGVTYINPYPRTVYGPTVYSGRRWR